ncbi:aldose epimerase [Neobacillus sp. C211]|uniref:aldose epimerase family protein n=1 Tax=unclassified Neobacillus TaxID=2675272 RepID=UPI00397BDF81
MYQIRKYKDGNLWIYSLLDQSSNSWIKVSPERGGIIMGFGVQGEEILYLDKDTFHNSKANIRGGIPILFPICGQLTDGMYALNGKTYPMKNHGVARINFWEVIETGTDGKASITLRLRSNEEIKRSYPFDFELNFNYVLKGNKLTIYQEYYNKSKFNMPLYAGFHPYFKALEKNIAYETDATMYLDYNDMKILNYDGKLDLSHMVESAVFLDGKKNNIAFSLPGLQRRIIMEYGEEFKYIVLWSMKGKDFICVEPWMAKPDEMNKKRELYILGPGQVLKTSMSITCQMT